MKVQNVIILLLAVVLIGSCFYFFLIAPLSELMLIGSLQPFKVESLNDARSYYSIVSAFIAFIVGSSGLIIGYFYYKDRNKHDFAMRRASDRLRRIDFLLSSLRSYDDAIRAILMKLCENELALGNRRATIRAQYQQMYLLLGANEKLLGLSQAELESLIVLFSYVDNSSELMELKATELGNVDLREMAAAYVALYEAAARSCMQCLVRLDSGIV